MKLKYAYIFIPLLALLVYFYINDSSPGSGFTRVSIGARAGLDSTDIAVIEIRGDGDDLFRAMKLGDEWRIESPAEVYADVEKINEFINAVAGVEIQRYLGSVDEDSLAAYSLDEPEKEIYFLDDRGNLLLNIKLGPRNEAGTGRYMLDGGNQLFLVPSKVSAFLDYDFSSLRSRQPLKIDREAVAAFEVSTGDTSLGFERDSGEWYMVKPDHYKVSNEWCEGYLTILDRLRAEEFLDGELPSDMEQLTGGVRIMPGTDDEKDLLFLGLDKRKGVIARSSLIEQPFFTEFRVADYIDVTPGEIRDDRVMTLGASQVGRVVFREVGGENLEFAAGGDKGFTVTRPAGIRKYEKEDFDAFLNAVLGVEAIRYIDDYESLSRLGLDPYWIKIEIYQHKNIGKVDLYIGAETKGGYYSSVNRSGKVIVISKDAVEAIVSAADKLRHKK